MALASTILTPWQLCSGKSGIFGLTHQAFVGRTQMKAGKRKSKGMTRITACDATEVSVVDDDGVLLPPEMAMGKRQLMTNLLLLGAVSVPNAGMLLPYPSHGLQEAKISRSSFPADFLFGVSSSAYQIEGAAFEGGKGVSIWDTFTNSYPNKILDSSNGNVADDSYHRFKEDVDIMKDIGLTASRFSISWTRILPRGKVEGGVNQEAINHYNDLIDDMLSNGIQPFVTLFHWDLPQALQNEYGGFLSPKIVVDFANYADVCFNAFGDRVKHWITLNEPQAYSTQGYENGQFPPLRCSTYVSQCCTPGDSLTEPYLVAHHQILAHAAAAKVYRDKYQSSQKGEIGIAVNTPWYVPLTDSEADREAVSRGLAFLYGWYLEPLYTGAYPAEMVERVGDRLPKFTPREQSLVKGSLDFIGINYYTARYVSNTTCQSGSKTTAASDSCIQSTAEKDGVPIGPKGGSGLFYLYPQGIQDLLEYTMIKFNNPIIYITENGIDERNNCKISLEDPLRIDCISQHLLYVKKAIDNGVNVKGYFIWSLLDDFEWTAGFAYRFGIVFVDFNDGLRRYPKKSALWLKEFLHGKETI